VQSPVFNAPCKTDAHCKEIYNTDYLCKNDKCGHDTLWQAKPAYILGFFLIVIISAVANAGGLGGGAVIVPVYMFCFNFVTPEAIPMSKATILAGAIMNVCLIINKRVSDNKNKLLIDYGIAGACIPLLLAGTMIGVMLTKVLPPILTVIFLTLYLVFSGWKMFVKARKETAKEKKRDEKEKVQREAEEAAEPLKQAEEVEE